MSLETKKRIHLIYGIVLIAVTVIAGICLMFGCYRIYTNGLAADAEQIYSREIIANAFAAIAIPHATGRPCPREPVENSTPGIWWEIWPLNLPLSQ